MKKSLFLSLIAVAATLVACNKTELVYEEGNMIGFTPAVSHLTKAALNSTTLPTDFVITTNGYWKSAATAGNGEDLAAFKAVTDAEETYIDAEPFKFMSNGLWHGDPTPYYWPKVGAIVFSGYTQEPAGATIAFSYANNAFTSSDFVQTHTTSATTDFMYFNLTDPASKSNVPVVFNHALSWLTIQVKAADETAAQKVVVNSIVLKNILDKATLNTADEDNMWSAQAFNDAQDADITVSNTDVAINTASYAKTDDDGVLIIPQGATSLEVTYTTTLAAGNTKTETVTVDLAGNGVWKDADGAETTEALNVWAAGRHYTYNLTIGLNEIILAPTVNEWKERTFDAFAI